MPGPQITVLHEDDSLIVVDKPPGIPTAPLREGEGDTLLSRVLSAFPEVSSLPGRKPCEPGLLHRLDLETSGVVVVARTPAAFEALRLQFISGSVGKEYHAACAFSGGGAGGPGETGGGGTVRIASRFAPAGTGRRRVRMVGEDERRGKVLRESTRSVYVTEAALVESRAGRALVRALIRRGFRHQVRAHLAHAGWPIFGDPLYGVPVPADAPQRMYLHASAITLEHPLTGKPLRVSSPVPEAFHLLLGPGTGR